MAIALLTHAIAGSADGNTVTTAGIDTTGASLLVLIEADFGGGSITPTDSKTNTWTAGTLYQIVGDITIQMWYCANPLVGAGHTFTLSTTGKAPSIAVASFSGTATVSPLDVQNGLARNSALTTIQPGSITPGAGGELVISGYSGYSSDVSSIDSSFTLLDHIVHNANHLTCGFAYIIQTSAVAENPTWTTLSANASAATVAAFKAAAASTVHPWWTYAGPMMGALGDTTSL